MRERLLTCCKGGCLGSKSGLRGTSSSGHPGSVLDSSSGRRPSSTVAERGEFLHDRQTFYKTVARSIKRHAKGKMFPVRNKL